MSGIRDCWDGDPLAPSQQMRSKVRLVDLPALKALCEPSPESDWRRLEGHAQRGHSVLDILAMQ